MGCVTCEMFVMNRRLTDDLLFRLILWLIVKVIYAQVLNHDPHIYEQMQVGLNQVMLLEWHCLIVRLNCFNYRAR